LEFLFLHEFPQHRRLKRLIASGLVVVRGYLGTDGAVRYFEHAARVHPEQFLYLSDLTDLSVAKNRMLIPAAFLNGNDLGTIKKHYRFPDVTDVFWGEPQREMVRCSENAEDVSDLRRVWTSDDKSQIVNAGIGLRFFYQLLFSILGSPPTFALAMRV
jgi:hypothetical protein